MNILNVNKNKQIEINIVRKTKVFKIKSKDLINFNMKLIILR